MQVTDENFADTLLESYNDLEDDKARYKKKTRCFGMHRGSVKSARSTSCDEGDKVCHVHAQGCRDASGAVLPDLTPQGCNCAVLVRLGDEGQRKHLHQIHHS